jgi:hypothetical protein
VAEVPPHYPNIAEILARKAEGRRQRASLSFAERLDILDAMKERVAPIVGAREARNELLKKDGPKGA